MRPAVTDRLLGAALALGVAIALGVALGVALAACQAGSSPSRGSVAASSSASTSSPSAPVAASAPSAPASPVDGIVLSIDSKGLADVRGFTLRAADGHVYAFTLGQLENGAQFPPGHLAEHQATGSPVRVSFRIEGGQLVVYRLDDAS